MSQGLSQTLNFGPTASVSSAEKLALSGRIANGFERCAMSAMRRKEHKWFDASSI